MNGFQAVAHGPYRALMVLIIGLANYMNWHMNKINFLTLWQVIQIIQRKEWRLTFLLSSPRQKRITLCQLSEASSKGGCLI